MGLAKRPANTGSVLADLQKGAAAPASAPQKATMPGAALAPVPANTVLTRPPTRIVISDFSNPGGIQALPVEQLTPLIAAARQARVVTIACRGDKGRPTKTGRAELLRKGAKVKAFLVAQGIEPTKIRVYVLSTGGFVADNSTSTGRAKNRRVEIRFS